jgi:exodeoxyribonuclease III
MENRGVLSRLKLSQESKGKFGFCFKTDGGKSFWLFNTHLPYFPYQPFQIAHIPYEDSPFLDSEQETQNSCASSRTPQLKQLLDDINASTNVNSDPILITGDFNEPSHLDWTCKASIAGYHPIICQWPETKLLEDHGFIDAYRFHSQSGVVASPGFTWCPRNPIPELELLNNSNLKMKRTAEHHDRIDFIFAKNHLSVESCETVGCSQFIPPDRPMASDSSTWPTDHQGVLATFNLGPLFAPV